ncbi:Catalase-related peroxidase [Paenibacillus auburnensis]|uniref:Catalase-related peroxidase n=1 Tax=Paenibacillus auburnensis TaxID=2905649 RepID=A0ABM9CQF9_9BACL|nr:catalase family peroxidase [Paenibacillus auburnensis]CAH1220329.1 Catalase-related peroxidase [Paenibacillus auburnensis]
MKDSGSPGGIPAAAGGSGLTSQAVDAIEDLSGVHPGYRRAHAKGICCRAVFRPNGLAVPFTTAAHLQEQEVEAVVRFSGSSTDPALADLLSPAKGMAVQFSLPDGSITNLVGVTLPVFFARTPESFVDIVRFVHRARAGNLGPLELIKEISAHFTESKSSFLALKKLQPPASYAESRYYCIHTYFLVDAEGNKRPVKFEWTPVTGVRALSLEDASQQPDHYLEDELALRLQDESPVFQLAVIFGEEDDPTDDPTHAWPDERRRIEIGNLHLTEIIDEPDGLLMDPAVVPAGIALSEDPILHFRHSAYGESFRRRREEH